MPAGRAVPLVGLVLVVFVAAVVGQAPTTGADPTVTAFPGPAGPMTLASDDAVWLVMSSPVGDGGTAHRFALDGATVHAVNPPEQQMAAIEITPGVDGAVWIGLSGFRTRDDHQVHRGFARITPDEATTYEVFPPLDTPSARLFALTTGPDGALWWFESDEELNSLGEVRLVTADPATPLDTTTYVLPPGSDPVDLVTGPDGALWFTDSGRGVISRVTVDGQRTDWAIPTPDASPGSIAVGPDGALWFAERKASKLGRITTSGEVTECPADPILDAPGEVSLGADGALWVMAGRPTVHLVRVEPSCAASRLDLSLRQSQGWRSLAWSTPGPRGTLWFSVFNGTVIRLDYDAWVGRVQLDVPPPTTTTTTSTSTTAPPDPSTAADAVVAAPRFTG